MPNSWAFPVPGTCGACGAVAEHPVWMIIDAAERPRDLEQLVREDRLRVGSCPACQATVPLRDAILLLYRPRLEPSLLMGIPAGDEPVAQDIGNVLLSRLRESLGPEWQDGVRTSSPCPGRPNQPAPCRVPARPHRDAGPARSRTRHRNRSADTTGRPRGAGTALWRASPQGRPGSLGQGYRALHGGPRGRGRRRDSRAYAQLTRREVHRSSVR